MSLLSVPVGWGDWLECLNGRGTGQELVHAKARAEGVVYAGWMVDSRVCPIYKGYGRFQGPHMVSSVTGRFEEGVFVFPFPFPGYNDEDEDGAVTNAEAVVAVAAVIFAVSAARRGS